LSGVLDFLELRANAFSSPITGQACDFPERVPRPGAPAGRNVTTRRCLSALARS